MEVVGKFFRMTPVNLDRFLVYYLYHIPTKNENTQDLR